MSTTPAPPVAETAAGKVRGEWRDGVATWRGIPYAVADRWEAPRPVPAWTGERAAARFGPVAEQSRAPQVAMLSGVTDKVASGEDCLVLNVYAPAAPAAAGADERLRPVVVWIHGGAFIMGSGSQPLYNGASFAQRHGVVVVTINYRLGVLGFGWLGVPNAALLDQIAALEWVRANIAGFGGDPAQVTVMGESAGAISIATLLAMPRARGLFARAVLQSGASPHAPMTADEARALGRTIAERLGARDAPLADVMAVQEAIVRERGLGAFAPYVDGVEVPAPPIEAVRRGEAIQVPLLIGSNRDEWGLFHAVFGDAVTSVVRAQITARLGEARVAEVLAGYRGERPWVDLVGDVVFRMPVFALADAHAAFAPVWMYRFDWTSGAFGGQLGAAHALELPFVWNRMDLPFSAALVGDVAAAQDLALVMHDAWARFIRGETPPMPGWGTYDPVRRTTMLFDRTSRVVDDADGERRASWPTF